MMLTGGMLLLSRIGSSGSPIVYIMIPGLLTAAGIAMSIVPSTIAATQGAKEGQAGLASGLVNTSRQIGGGLGLAVLVTLATQHSSHLIGTGALVPQALTDGFRLAYLIGAGLAAAAALVTFTALPKPVPAAIGPGAALGPGTASGPTAAPDPGAIVADRRNATRRFAAAIALVVAGFVALDLAFAGSHGAPVGAYTTKRRLQLRHRAHASPAQAPQGRPDPHRQAGERLHLHRQLLQPELPPARRPERAADPRPQPAARLVPAGSRKGRRLQPEPADLRRQAGARLVAGRCHQHRPNRERRRRGRQPALPAGRTTERQPTAGCSRCTSW